VGIKIQTTSLQLYEGDSLSEIKLDFKIKSFRPGQWVVLNQSNSKNYLAMVDPFSMIGKHLVVVKELDTNLKEFESHSEDEIVSDYIKKSLKDAIDARTGFNRVLGPCFRMFFGSSDGIPGLVIDKYVNCWSVQFFFSALIPFENVVEEELVKIANNAVIFSKDQIDGGVFKNKVDSEYPNAIEIEDNGLKFSIDFQKFQKTGFYFDHSANRQRLCSILEQSEIKPETVLDLFCYLGGWGFLLLKKELASHVTFVDQGDFEQNFLKTGDKNQIQISRFNFIRRDIFDFFKENKKKYDLIICDPPAFSKSIKNLESAYEGYKKLAKYCLQAINEGGLVVFASCTNGTTFEKLSTIFDFEARKLRKKCQIVDLGTQRIDHPISSFTEQAFYLKYILFKIK